MAHEVIKWHLVISLTKSFFHNIVAKNFFCANDVTKWHFMPFFVKKAQKWCNRSFGDVINTQKKSEYFFCNWTSLRLQNKGSNTRSCYGLLRKQNTKNSIWRHRNDQWRRKMCSSDVILEQNVCWTFCERVDTSSLWIISNLTKGPFQLGKSEVSR